MLLIQKGKPTKALCAGCKRLFVASEKQLESLASGRSTMAICQRCKDWADQKKLLRRKYI